MGISDLSITIEKSFSHLREREIESILSLGNGYIGTRNSLEEFYPDCNPASFIGNMYVQGPDDEFNFLVKIPDWTRIKIYVDDELLNLRTQEVIENSRSVNFAEGIAVREWKNKDKHGRITNIKILKYISLANKNGMGKLLVIKPENYTGNIRVTTGIDCGVAEFGYLLNMNSESRNFALVHMKTKYSDRELKIFQKSTFEAKDVHIYYIENSYNGSYENFEWRAELGKCYAIESLCSLNGHPMDSFDKNFDQHKAKWAERWQESRILIKGNVYDQRLVNFATYHLVNSGEFSGNSCSIPARNLSGESYMGHVFWDTEMYLLPFFILTKPEIARALLMYRYNTLNGARQNAINEGYKGASYAWESTDTGLEAAPSVAILPNGEVIPILSGKHEIHISPDIAYTVWKYWEATGDEDFLVNYGAEMIFETARYCESYITKEDDGLYHINKVIGPDEYHELVDDNAYTNYLVRNNFDVAIKTKEKLNIKDEETERWKEITDKIYSGLNPKTGLYEQFKGYYNLEYIDLNEYEPRTVPMDVILGREKTSKTQVVKQADVLMFMFLFGGRFSKEDVAINYDFYEKRCGHGSSLSPSIHCIIAARTGKIQDAYRYFLKNAQIDIGNEFGNAAGGVHIASAGGAWMSVVMGFAGLYYAEDGFWFDPHLPEEWESIEFSIVWKGERKDIYIDRESIIAT
ncbi:MAG: hypothetical protein A2Y25_02300 [Candidatus Melainabacteria bacterium GWF2_37_15]|nr:MAG: hypothetical protein A2Y25_02300 [Candidatus Melainabacteria bacterium GWF2_37_15]